MLLGIYLMIGLITLLGIGFLLEDVELEAYETASLFVGFIFLWPVMFIVIMFSKLLDMFKELED